MVKKLEFEHDRKQWDAYKAFHIRHDRYVVHFETGEVIITHNYLRPYARNRSDQFGLSYIRSNDSASVLDMLRTPDGTPVKKSWLDRAMYLYDHTTRQFLRIDRWHNQSRYAEVGVPPHMAVHHPVAYCAGPERPWVSPTMVHYSTPAKLTKDEKAHIREIVTACQAASRVGGLKHHSHYENPRGTYFMPYPWKDLLTQNYTDLPDFDKAVIVWHGVAKPRVEHSVAFLKVGEI